MYWILNRGDNRMFRKLALASTIILAASPAFADPVASPVATANDSAPITLTFGELKDLIAAQVAQAQAAQVEQKAKGAMAKLQEQLAPKPKKEPMAVPMKHEPKK
jgi:hypothetical protein